MTVNEQAEKSFGEFVEYHLANPTTYWGIVEYKDAHKLDYMEGWFEGYSARLAVGYDPTITDDDMWTEGEYRAYRGGQWEEIRGKYFAAGFTGGYKQLKETI